MSSRCIKKASVANVIGAVAGWITISATGSMIALTEGIFKLHLTDGPEDLSQKIETLQRLEKVLRVNALSISKNSGAEDLQFYVENDARKANVETNKMLLEAISAVNVTGRPRITG